MAGENEGDKRDKPQNDTQDARTIGTISSIAAKTNTNDSTHDKILNESYETGTLCDIQNGYKWTIDKIIDASTIPYCYLIEYKQEHNSIITNLVNSITSAAASVNTLIEDGKNGSKLDTVFNNLKSLSQAVATAAIGELSNETKDSLKEIADGSMEVASQVADVTVPVYDAVADSEIVKDTSKNIGEFGSGLMSAISAAWNFISDKVNIKNGITEAEYLKPYSLLYWLKATNKRYVFPMVGELPKHKLNNVFGDSNGDFSVFSANSWISSISNFASEIPSAIRDVVELTGANGRKFSGTFIEKAKFFQYPQDTEEYTIQFPLINTVRGSGGEPEWMKNYKFIMLFMLRNMIFRKNNAEYYPPLFYDLYIPGVIRQPFCYVQNVEVQPFGMTRMKSYEKNFIGRQLNVKVPVPEMWMVTIKLKSLVPTSANLVLSGMLDLNINLVKRDVAGGPNQTPTFLKRREVPNKPQF